MDGHSKRTRHNKLPKQPRKSRPIPLRPIISGEISSQYSHQSDTLTARSSGSGDLDRLNYIIDDITSEGDDARVAPSSSNLPRKTVSNLVVPNSPPVNENHESLYTLPYSSDYNPDRTSSTTRSGRSKKPSNKDKQFRQFGETKNFSPSRKNNSDDRTDATNRRKSVGDARRHQLTEFMEYYRNCLESAQNSNTIGINDDPTKNDKRKQYTTTLWYELKRYFNGINPSDETGIELEQLSIEHQRKRYLDEFYFQFTQCDFEQSKYPYDDSPIQRRHISEVHLNYCYEIDKAMENLF